MSDVEEMSWDSSYDTVLLGGEENSTISEEQETVLTEHINYHDEMKKFLERWLYKGQTEGQMVASFYFKQNKPSKPKASLGNLFEQNSQRLQQCAEEMNNAKKMHNFLKSKIRNQPLQEQPAINYIVFCYTNLGRNFPSNRKRHPHLWPSKKPSSCYRPKSWSTLGKWITNTSKRKNS